MRLIFTLLPQFKRKKEKRNKKQMRRGSALSDRTNVELSLKMKRRKEKEGEGRVLHYFSCCVLSHYPTLRRRHKSTAPLLHPSVRPRGNRKSGAKQRKRVKMTRKLQHRSNNSSKSKRLE